MKRLSLILAISFVLLSFGLSYAVDIEVIVDPSYMWDNGGTPEIKANSEFVIEYQMGNTTGTMTGYNMNMIVYGEGVITNVTYGATSSPATPSDLQGIEYVGAFAWTATSTFYNDNWDGALPDTMAHSVLDFGGWDEVGMSTKYEVTMTINMIEGDAGNICITNTTEHPNNDHNWLFAQTAVYQFPTCFPVSKPLNTPPVITCPGGQLTAEHDETFDLTGIAVEDFDEEGANVVTGVTASIGTISNFTPGQAATFDWSYSPNCGEVGTSMNVTFTATDGTADSDPCIVDLVVNNTAPEIAGDCGAAMTLGTNSSKTLEFSATDANSGDTKDWSIGTIVVNSGDLTGTTVTVDAFGEVTVSAGANEVNATVPVIVTDCAGATAECSFEFTVVGSLPFMIVIEKKKARMALVFTRVSMLRLTSASNRLPNRCLVLTS